MKVVQTGPVVQKTYRKAFPAIYRDLRSGEVVLMFGDHNTRPNTLILKEGLGEFAHGPVGSLCYTALGSEDVLDPGTYAISND